MVSQTNPKTALDSDKKVKVCQTTSRTRNLWEIIDANEVKIEEDGEDCGSPQKCEMVDKDLIVGANAA